MTGSPPAGTGRGAIVAASTLQPYSQGEFDNFCGIYAAINALRLLLEAHRPLTHAECARLFITASKAMERDGLLLRATSGWGISQVRWRQLVRSLCRSASRITEFHVSSATPLPENRRWPRAHVFATVHAAIDAQRPVLLPLRGTYNHYTVVCAYTPSRLILHDSYGYSWIRKAACGVTLEPGRWRHRIATPSIIVLGVKP